MAYQVERPATSGPVKSSVQRNSRSVSSFLTLIIVLLIVGGGLFTLIKFTSTGRLGSVNLQNDWQAVFLTNGQVYFGKVKSIDQDFISLTDIYYLQVVNQPLQRSGTEEQPAGEQETEERLTLFKLGNEIHGPRDEMSINLDQVVLIEDLKDDSRVVQAINDYVNQNKPK